MYTQEKKKETIYLILQTIFVCVCVFEQRVFYILCGQVSICQISVFTSKIKKLLNRKIKIKYSCSRGKVPSIIFVIVRGRTQDIS